MATFTVEQARQKWEQAGKAWTPEVEAKLRQRGIIAEPIAPIAPIAAPAPSPAAPPRSGLSGWQELGAGLGSMIAGPMRGGGLLDAAARTATGTTMGEQVTAGALGGLTAGQVSPADLGIPDPTSVVQRGANLFGQGAGMATAFTPIGKGAGALTAGIANPLARAAVTGGLSFGAYNALAPAEDAGQWAQNVGEGALTGAVLGPLPLLPGVRNVAALPGGRTAIDLAAFTGLGAVHGQDPGTAFLEAIPQLPAMRLVHSAAEGPRRPGRQTPEQSTAAIDALESLLANERAPMQAEISARVEPFREAQANAQAVAPEVSPAEYNLPLSKRSAAAPEPAPAPAEAMPEQYQRTLARIEAMRARQAAPPSEPTPMPEPAPAPEPPLARTPAQMEIPLGAGAPASGARPAETVVAYHGTGENIRRLQKNIHDETNILGVALTTNPEVASRYAEDAYGRRQTHGSPNVMRVTLRGRGMKLAEFEKMIEDKYGRRRNEFTPEELNEIARENGVDWLDTESIGAPGERFVLNENAIEYGDFSPAEPRPAKETRGQRRARLQAEASAVNAEAAAKMGVAPASAPEPARRMTKKEIEAQRVRQQIDQGSRDLAEAMGRPKPLSSRPEDYLPPRKSLDERMAEYDAKMAETSARLEAQTEATRAASVESRKRFMEKQEASDRAEVERKLKTHPFVENRRNELLGRMDASFKKWEKLSQEAGDTPTPEAERKMAEALEEMRAAGAEYDRFDALPARDAINEVAAEKSAATNKALDAVEKVVESRRPRGDVTTDMLGGQQVFEAAARAVRDVVADAKDIPRRARNAKAELKTDFAAARSELVRDVAENPSSVPFSRANRGEQTFDEAVNEYASQPRRVARVDNLRQYPENATPGVKDIIDSENLSALAHDISKPVADRIDAGFTKELAQKHRGLTDPVRKTQEVYDGELASAGEMSEIHGGREIEMSAYKKAAEIGDRYRDLKTRTGVTTPEQMDIAGRLLDRYTSSNRGHAADDLGFVRDPENRRLLVESGNPQGIFEYVRELRRMMDEAANLYDTASRASGGYGIGDIAAYFPKVATKPKFFEIGERLARAKARKGSDPRTRNTAEEVFNPRSERRSSTDPDKVELDGREVAREWNAERVFEGYIDSMLRGITGDIALSQSIKIAKYMEIKADIAERRGDTAEAEQLRIRANITRNLAQQKWNHQLFETGARAEDFLKSLGTPGQMALEGLAANKRAFDNTKYRLNPRFNLVTQWTSVLNPTFADPVAALLALRDMGVPGMPTEAKKFAEATYEYRRKAMPHSAMRAQAEGTGSVASTISSPLSGPRKFATVAEKVFFDGLTQGIEAWANKYSALIGYHSTRNLKGLTPRQRALAAGETVFKTQSAFTFGERAGVLNSRAVQGTWPAQGYAVELANQVREALGQTGVDSRLYGETQTQQARRAGAIVAAAVMQNLWQNLIFNAMRGKDIEESFNFDSVWDATLALPPFISILLPTGKSGRDMPNPALLIAQGNMVVNKLGRVAEKVAKGEDATGAVVDATRYGLGNWGGPGGAFASDVMGGRYDFLLGEDEGAGNVPNTVRARPAPARPARVRPAVPRR